MKIQFKVQSGELGRTILGLSRIIAGKHTLAILDHFLFEVAEQELQITASDNENMMVTTIDIIESTNGPVDKPIKFCVRYDVVCDVLKNLPDQPMSFDVYLSKDEIVLSYMSGHIKFPCVSGKEYPIINFCKENSCVVSLDSDLMLKDINSVCPFTAQDTIRLTLNAVCFNFQKEYLDVVSTNGNVLMKISHKDVKTENEKNLLLPPKPVSILKYFLNKAENIVNIIFNDNSAVFECNNWKLTCRLIEGRYPNYDSVIPTISSCEVEIEKKTLQDAIKRILPMGNQEIKGILMEFEKDTLTLSSENTDFSTSAKETIPCNYPMDYLFIGVNGEIFHNLLSHVPTDNVKLLMTTETRPILIVPETELENEEFYALIMPALINK